VRGRKPIPAALQRLRGDPRHLRGRLPTEDSEPERSEKAPRPPAFLKGEARKFWHRYVPMLWEAGLVTKIDTPILSGAAVNYAQWRNACDEIELSGTVIKGGKSGNIPMLSPFVRVAREAQLAWQRALLEFGMSASSRTRVKVSKPEKADPFELFVLEGKKKA